MKDTMDEPETTDSPVLTAPLQEPGEPRARYWERLRQLARSAGVKKREAYQWASERTAELWVEPPKPAKPEPPTPEPDIAEACEIAEPEVADEATEDPEAEANTDADLSVEEAGDAITAGQPDDVVVIPAAEIESMQPQGRARARDDGSQVVGLGDLPANWPPLPPNAPLAVEIQWVQSSRIDVVEELPSGGVQVHLDRADRPAPSKAAIGWLETSIRAYTKFVDVAAKATSQLEDEREHVQRERLAIAEVRSLLAEMLAE